METFYRIYAAISGKLINSEVQYSCCRKTWLFNNLERPNINIYLVIPYLVVKIQFELNTWLNEALTQFPLFIGALK